MLHESQAAGHGMAWHESQGQGMSHSAGYLHVWARLDHLLGSTTTRKAQLGLWRIRITS